MEAKTSSNQEDEDESKDKGSLIHSVCRSISQVAILHYQPTTRQMMQKQV